MLASNALQHIKIDKVEWVDVCNKPINNIESETKLMIGMRINILQRTPPTKMFDENVYFGNAKDGRQLSDEDVLTNFTLCLTHDVNRSLEFFLQSNRIKWIIDGLNLARRAEIYTLLFTIKEDMPEALLSEMNRITDAKLLKLCISNPEINIQTKLNLSKRLSQLETKKIAKNKRKDLSLEPTDVNNNSNTSTHMLITQGLKTKRKKPRNTKETMEEAVNYLVYAKNGRPYTLGKDKIECTNEKTASESERIYLTKDSKEKVVPWTLYLHEFIWMYADSYKKGMEEPVADKDLDNITSTLMPAKQRPISIYSVNGREVGTKGTLRKRFSAEGKKILEALNTFIPGVFVCQHNGQPITVKEFASIDWAPNIWWPVNVNGVIRDTEIKVVTKHNFDISNKRKNKSSKTNQENSNVHNISPQTEASEILQTDERHIENLSPEDLININYDWDTFADLAELAKEDISNLKEFDFNVDNNASVGELESDPFVTHAMPSEVPATLFHDDNDPFTAGLQTCTNNLDFEFLCQYKS